MGKYKFGRKKIAPSGAAFYILGQAATPEDVLFTC